METKTVITTVKMETELRAWLEQEAKKKRQPLSSIIRAILWDAKDNKGDN